MSYNTLNVSFGPDCGHDTLYNMFGHMAEQGYVVNINGTDVALVAFEENMDDSVFVGQLLDDEDNPTEKVVRFPFSSITDFHVY